MKINDLLLRLTKEKYLNRWIIFLIDLFLSVFSTVTSLALVSYILDWNYTDQIILTVFLASLFCSTASFLVCQTYKGIIRHSAFTETGRIAMSSSLKVATILPVLLFTTGLLSFRGFLLGSVVDLFLTFFILTIFRAFLITLYTFMVSSIVSNRKDKLFIFGHEDSSPALLNDSFLRENSSYQVEGFLRFGQRVSMRIGLYKVYFITDQEEFSRWVNRYNIKAILFTDYKAVKEESERLVRFLRKRKSPYVAPSFFGRTERRQTEDARPSRSPHRRPVRTRRDPYQHGGDRGFPERQSRFGHRSRRFHR